MPIIYLLVHFLFFPNHTTGVYIYINISIYIYISIHIIAGDISCYIMLSPMLVIYDVISPWTTHLWLVNSPFFQHTESWVPCRVALLSLSWFRAEASVCRTGNMEKRQQEAMMVSSWDLMVIYRDGMWFHGDLMGIYRDLMGFNGIYRDIMGYNGDSIAICL